MGGKSCIIKQLTSIISSQYYDRFYDLFGGSGKVTMSIMPNCKYQQINDYEKSIAIIYMALSREDTTIRMIDKFKDLWVSQTEYDTAKEIWDEFEESGIDLLDVLNGNINRFTILAKSAYILHLCSYGGVYKKGRHEVIDIATSEKCARYTSTSNLIEAHKTFENIVTTNLDALEIIKEMSASDYQTDVSMIYLDVPYLSDNISGKRTGATYAKSFSEIKHKEMLEILSKLPNSTYKIIISNYSNDVYDDFLDTNYNWYKTWVGKRPINCANGNIKKKKDVVDEYIYSNFLITGI